MSEGVSTDLPAEPVGPEALSRTLLDDLDDEG
jgi:hypothetical protein